MNKKHLTEADIPSKFVTLALVGDQGDTWNLMTQIREEAYFTKGQVNVPGRTVRRGEAKKADYILSYKPDLHTIVRLPYVVFNPDTGPGDVDSLLPEYEQQLAQIAETRVKLKAQLMEALSR